MCRLLGIVASEPTEFRIVLKEAPLAEELGVSKAYITQTLDGGRNLTLRSLADFAWALNCHARVSLAPQEFDESRSIIESSVDLVEQRFEVDESVWAHKPREVDLAA